MSFKEIEKTSLDIEYNNWINSNFEPKNSQVYLYMGRSSSWVFSGS